jgi:peptidase M28-like protein
MMTGADSRSTSTPARSAAFALVLVLLGACGSPRNDTPDATLRPALTAGPTTAPPTTPPPATPVVEQLDVDAIMDHVRALSVEIGLRNAGSKGDERASTYLADRIARLGWHVERRPFPLPQGGVSWNVVGTPPAFDESAPYVIVGGHYDSLNGPGANDNATGVAVALEVARSVDMRPAPLPVVFVGMGAEERQPVPERAHHVGSRHYVSKMSGEARRNLRAYMNVDMVGHGDVIQCPRMSSGPREGADRCLRLAKQLGIAARARITPDWSDNGSFLRAGMNASWVWTGDYTCCYHNPKDTIDIVRRDDVRRAGALALAIVRSYTS